MPDAVRSLLAVAWDFGDGTGVTGTLTPTHTYGDDGVYTVTLVVTDEWGAAGWDTLAVTASNAAPELSPIPDQQVSAGYVLTVTVAYSDPGWLDTHTAALAWGDGLTATLALSAGLGSFEAAHTYALAGSYTAAVTLADDNSGQDAEAFTVTVAAQSPFTIYLPLILHLHAPVAVDDFGPGFATDEDTPFLLADVLANDYDPDGRPLSIAGFDTSATHGLVALVPGSSGTLDSSFDGDGRVTTDFFGGYADAYALVVQPDGKLVAAGSAINGSSVDFALARYHPDGSLDASFGSDGLVTTDFFGGYDNAYALALQPDGKLVVAGSAYIGPSYSGSDYDFALARYHPDGSLDANFDGDGKLTTDFGGRFEGACPGLCRRMAAVGSPPSPPEFDDMSRSLQRMGPTFGGVGKLTTDFGGDSAALVVRRR
jgi:uncharacterized delta-60 repeat protein